MEVQSHKISKPFDHHKDLRALWNTIDWENSKQHRNPLRRFLSDEKLESNRKHHRHHHHHKKLFCNSGITPYKETVIPPRTRRQSMEETILGDIEELENKMEAETDTFLFSWMERLHMDKPKISNNNHSYLPSPKYSLTVQAISEPPGVEYSKYATL